MRKEIIKGEPLQMFFKEFYEYVQEFYEPDDDQNCEAYWKSLIDKGSEIFERYKTTTEKELAIDMIVSFMHSRQIKSRSGARECLKQLALKAQKE